MNSRMLTYWISLSLMTIRECNLLSIWYYKKVKCVLNLSKYAGVAWSTPPLPPTGGSWKRRIIEKRGHSSSSSPFTSPAGLFQLNIIIRIPIQFLLNPLWIVKSPILSHFEIYPWILHQMCSRTDRHPLGLVFVGHPILQVHKSFVFVLWIGSSELCSRIEGL